jgi:hypothetical protein
MDHTNCLQVDIKTIQFYIHTEVDNDIREQVRDEVQKNNAGLMDGSVAAVPSADLPAS